MVYRAYLVGYYEAVSTLDHQSLLLACILSMSHCNILKAVGILVLLNMRL